MNPNSSLTARLSLVSLTLVAVFLLFGCVSKEPTLISPRFDSAEWESQAEIIDKARDKTNKVNIDISAIRESKARLEVSAVLGIPVATATISKDEFKCALVTQKKFYFGRSTEDALLPLLRIPIHPMDLVRIIFEEPLRSRGWVCKSGRTGQIEQCENTQYKTSVRWYDRVDGAKKVTIVSPQVEMNWSFSQPKTKVQFPADTFSLEPPDSFRRIKLN